MQMLMIVFRASLKERAHELLHQCDVKAFTEVNETVGTENGNRKCDRLLCLRRWLFCAPELKEGARDEPSVPLPLPLPLPLSRGACCSSGYPLPFLHATGHSTGHGRGLRGKVESLNVSVATAVVLYEILRQRAGTNAFTRAVPG